MSGSIIRSADGWQYVIDAGLDANGRRRQRAALTPRQGRTLAQRLTWPPGPALMYAVVVRGTVLLPRQRAAAPLHAKDRHGRPATPSARQDLHRAEPSGGTADRGTCSAPRTRTPALGPVQIGP
jgi:hypothetical protein